ncbi:MAG TPA: hypothetical protein VF850_15505 [Gemmatimonadaceae bacterium]
MYPAPNAVNGKRVDPNFISAHAPAGDNSAQWEYGAVIKLLEKAPVRGSPAHRRYKVTWRGQVFRLNAIQHCYGLLYDARNHFLHGDPVSFTTLLPRRKTKTLSLPRIAALIYRYALVGYLSERYKRTETMKNIGRDILEMVDESSYEQAVAHLLGLKERGWRGGRRRLPSVLPPVV